MFGDFQISKNGDLVFLEQSADNTTLHLKFSLTQTNALKVSFGLEEFDIVEPSENALKLSFDIVRKTANKTAAVIRESDATNQLIILKLKAVLGELPLRSDFGSKISLMIHKEINDTNLLSLENYIKECISDIMPNCYVKATPYINYNNGYMQTVKVQIYDDSENILTYILER